jgi:cytochrome c biogenesis protein CcmG/thiol:disulfide interchange protein DsbE
MEEAIARLEQMGNPYWLVLVDYDSRYALDWGIYGAPETFLVDGRGIVRWKHVGPLTDGIIDSELLPALTQAEKAR